MDALGVVTGDDEDLCSSIDAYTKLVQQVRCSLHDELLNHGHKFLDLLIEGKPTFRNRTQRMADRVVWGFSRAGSKRCVVPGDHSLDLLGGLSAEFFGCVHDHRFEGDHRCRAIFHRGAVGNFQLPDHFHGPMEDAQVATTSARWSKS